MPIDPDVYDVPLTASRWDRVLFRLEHLLLSRGASDVARLRGYLRVREWRAQRSARERLHAIKVAAKLPARALRESWRAVGKYGGPVARDFGVTPRRQLLHLWWLWVRHGMYPPVYYGFKLFMPGQLRRAPAFFQRYEDDEVYRLLNVRTALADANLLLDKRRFERWLIDRSFPAARTILEFAEGGVTDTSLPDGALPRCDLISKPNDSLKGQGVRLWSFDGERWTGAEGGRRSEAELIAELKALSRKRPILLQERLRNHPALDPIAPKALSTVRVLTLRSLDGRVRVILATHRIPVGDGPTDNMSGGGIGAPVNLATGRLGHGVTMTNTGVVEPRDRHPETGVQIAGFQLPHWADIMDLVVRVHEALDRIVCVGWDVAILADGPILIEGNDNPGHTSSQVPTGVPIGETLVAPTVLARLRESFAAPYRQT